MDEVLRHLPKDVEVACLPGYYGKPRVAEPAGHPGIRVSREADLSYEGLPSSGATVPG